MIRVFQIIFILCLALLNVSCREDQAKTKLCFKSKCIFAEVVDEPSDMMRGLQLRAVLGRNRGMLFVFPKDQIARFWMKNTYISLDMLWVDKDLKILHIEPSVPPCSKEPCQTYQSEQLARYVLEVNAGFCKEYGIEVGEKITVNQDNNKSQAPNNK